MISGADIVSLARAAVEAEVKDLESPPVPVALSEPSGVFVTLKLHPSGDLRGCIGYPMPVMPLGEAILESAEEVCHDPRFPDLAKEELGSITVEVTVLTPPEPVRFDDPSELPGLISIGRDGLIIEAMGHRGLLLPQVPVEWGWGPEEYLDHLCMKAGLPSDFWRGGGFGLWSFRGDVWYEDAPYGEVYRG